MTELEKQKCHKLMWEGIRNGREAQDVFKRTNISEVRCGLQIRNKAMPKELTRHLLTLVIAIQI